MFALSPPTRGGTVLLRCPGLWWVGLLLPGFVLAGCQSPVPREVRQYNEDGLHLFHEGSYQRARACFQAALASKPGDANLHYNIGRCFDHSGDAAKAERSYRRCLGIELWHSECQHALVSLLVRTGRRPEAEQQIDAWLRREPTRADPYVVDGWLRLRDGDLLKARTRFQQALQYNPHHRYALTQLAHLYERCGRPDRALALCEWALHHHPNEPELVSRVKRLREQGVRRPQPD